MPDTTTYGQDCIHRERGERKDNFSYPQFSWGNAIPQAFPGGFTPYALRCYAQARKTPVSG